MLKGAKSSTATIRFCYAIMSNPKPQPSGDSVSSIEVDHREYRSIPSAVIQIIIKAVAAQLLKLGHAEPAGSPRLIPHKSAEKLCQIRESRIEETWIYTFSNKDAGEGENPRVVHKLYYFAGGGFRQVAGRLQWLVCVELSSKLPEYEINLVSYPLAPNNPASTSIPHLQRLYRTLAVQSKAQNFRITLMGDSAGGNLSLVLGIYAASEFLNGKTGERAICPVESILVISPPLDLRHENPEIDVITHKDPLFSRKMVKEMAASWEGEWLLSDPQLSPILADLSVLQQANIKVDGVVGGYDVFAPDTKLFRERLAEFGVDGEWLVWNKQMHCFPLMFSLHMYEGVLSKDWLLDVLRSNAKRIPQ
jgi:acetyl esterase/lipase